MIPGKLNTACVTYVHDVNKGDDSPPEVFQRRCTVNGLQSTEAFDTRTP